MQQHPQDTQVTCKSTLLIHSLSLSRPDHPIMMGFEPLVNQRLLPPTFPRYAKIIKREEMVNYFTKLIERIKTVCDVINTSNLHSILVLKLFKKTTWNFNHPFSAALFTCVFYSFFQDFFCEFSEQSPCVLSRSLLQVHTKTLMSVTLEHDPH